MNLTVAILTNPSRPGAGRGPDPLNSLQDPGLRRDEGLTHP